MTITGFVVDMDDTVRSVDTWDQQNKVNVKKHVLNCTLVDETGAAARIDFWEDQADKVYEQLIDEVANGPVGICLTFLSATKEEKSARPYKRFCATKKTTFSNSNVVLTNRSEQQISEKTFCQQF